ncbi:MAG: Holliday junction resolvase RuvX [Gemmatimonadetes bacterium]|nr:Holliday junction resolvase RuvX [Gemmatimonadota bacterium]
MGGWADERKEPADHSSAHPLNHLSAHVPPVGRLLAVDWGEKRIGLALSDPTQTLAQPLATLSRRSGRRFPMKAFREHVETHLPVGFVVGLPIEGEGTLGPAAKAAQELGDLIGRSTGLPVVFQDERMTTARARRAVDDMGGKTRGREGEVDQLAATVLLQAFLDARRR